MRCRGQGFLLGIWCAFPFIGRIGHLFHGVRIHQWHHVLGRNTEAALRVAGIKYLIQFDLDDMDSGWYELIRADFRLHHCVALGGMDRQRRGFSSEQEYETFCLGSKPGEHARLPVDEGIDLIDIRHEGAVIAGSSFGRYEANGYIELQGALGLVRNDQRILLKECRIHWQL